jgi:hypothetical protein
MSEQGDLQDARTLGNVSTALFIVGGLGIGVGLSSLLMSLGGEEPESTADSASRGPRAPRTELRVGLGTLGLGGSF